MSWTAEHSLDIAHPLFVKKYEAATAHGRAANAQARITLTP
jgi:hypothetical protein